MAALLAVCTDARAASQAQEAIQKVQAAMRGGWQKSTASSWTKTFGDLAFVRVGDKPWQMGVWHCVKIEAPLARVNAVLEDVPGYVGIFKDVKEARKIPGKDSNSFSIFTETSIPIPLVPNDRTEIAYRAEKKPDWIFYGLDLKKGNHLLAYGGAQTLRGSGKNETETCELDVFEVDYGSSRMLPERKFWKEALLGSLQTDLAVKLKSEDAKASAESILKKSDDQSEKREGDVEHAYQNPIAFEAWTAGVDPEAKKESARPNLK